MYIFYTARRYIFDRHSKNGKLNLNKPYLRKKKGRHKGAKHFSCFIGFLLSCPSILNRQDRKCVPGRLSGLYFESK